LLSPETDIFSYIEKKAKETFKVYSYNEIRIPTVELTELFIKSTGETTDIVEKEMYSFTDAGKRNISLRPEGTPCVARAYIQNKLNLSGKNSKFFYIGNMFRAERPQAGRFREFEQIGIEYLGNPSASADAEAIILLLAFLKTIGVKDYFTEINSLGCSDCREKYKKELLEYLKKNASELCEWCQKRIEKNPLRALDCKIDGPRLANEAPALKLCGDCSSHFEKVQELLNISEIDFKVNRSLVRGLDYYTRTVFEVKSSALGSQDTIVGGGRYDNLIKSMGGQDTPAVGWSMGVDRLAMLLKDTISLKNNNPDIFVVCADKKAFNDSFKILNNLRNGNISADFSNFELSLRSQMRSADKSGATLALIMGEEELKNSSCSIKFLKSKKEQQKIPLNKLLEKIKNILKKETHP
ncbi:MAG: histidine--tRNA ligase, partial [Elusimicrobiota bacterium]|nr:histidine--tRNA ligase [Elusimicrobiota bacterium]